MTGCFPAAHLNDPATVEHTTTSQADQPSICYSGVDSPGRASRGFGKLDMGPARREAPRRLPVHTLEIPRGVAVIGSPRQLLSTGQPMDCESGWGVRHFRGVGQPLRALPPSGHLGLPPGLPHMQVDCPPRPRHSKMVGGAEYQPTVDRA